MLTTSQSNVFATVHLGCRIDLETIALHARNVEYNLKVRIHVRSRDLLLILFQRSAAVIMRIRESETTALIFASGKMARSQKMTVDVRVASMHVSSKNLASMRRSQISRFTILSVLAT